MDRHLNFLKNFLSNNLHRKIKRNSNLYKKTKTHSNLSPKHSIPKVLVCRRIKQSKEKYFKAIRKKKKLRDNNFQRVGIKEPRRMELEMVMAHFTTNKEVNIQVTGTIIKWMVMAHYIILMAV